MHYAHKLYNESLHISCAIAISKQKLTFQPLRHHANKEESKAQPIKMLL